MTNEKMISAPRARIAGVVYLLYLGAVELAWVMAGRRPVVSRDALLLSSFFYLALGVLFYGIFRPVNKRVSLEAMLFAIAESLLGVMHVFGIASQVRAIAFLGPFALLIGWLIVRSTFLPHILGWMMMLCGAGWLAYLSPEVAQLSHGRMSEFSFVAEGSLAVWLVVMGVDRERWQQQAKPL